MNSTADFYRQLGLPRMAELIGKRYVDYTFRTETGYVGCGILIVSSSATDQEIRIAAFADARSLGFYNVQSVTIESGHALIEFPA